MDQVGCLAAWLDWLTDCAKCQRASHRAAARDWPHADGSGQKGARLMGRPAEWPRRGFRQRECPGCHLAVFLAWLPLNTEIFVCLGAFQIKNFFRALELF